jgi:hypothetical protein
MAAAPPAEAPANDASVRYQLMQGAGENWIPFIPVHLPDDNREIQLQRASMPRLRRAAALLPVRGGGQPGRRGRDAVVAADQVAQGPHVPPAGRPAPDRPR